MTLIGFVLIIVGICSHFFGLSLSSLEYIALGIICIAFAEEKTRKEGPRKTKGKGAETEAESPEGKDKNGPES